MKKNFSLRIYQLIAIIVISIFAGYFFGIYKIHAEWKNFKPIINVQSQVPPQGTSLNMALFYEVLDRVNRDYYDKTKVDSKKVLYGAISGMLQSLDDPYTSFFPPKENTSFKTQLSGQFEGIGAELGLSDQNRVIVVSPLDGSPAQKAGIKSGDAILKVGEDSTIGWTLPQVVDKIRGPKGTPVKLTILHEKDKTPKDLSIVRDVITVKSVTGWLKQVNCTTDGKCENKESCSTCGSVAYIRLSQFGDRTNNEFLGVVNDLYGKIQKEKNFKGVILDLRNNPGGYLNDAVFIASEFIKDGVVVIQQDGSGSQTPLSVSRKGLLTDIPVIVLVNKGSASASEIVAGALRDHGRAKLAGEQSFGKGTIQSAIDVDDGASVHLSIGKWLTPNGTWVHKVGLTPDIEVALDSKSINGLGFDNQLQKAISELLK